MDSSQWNEPNHFVWISGVCVFDAVSYCMTIHSLMLSPAVLYISVSFIKKILHGQYLIFMDIMIGVFFPLSCWILAWMVGLVILFFFLSFFLFFCQLKQRKILVIIMLIELSALINLCNSNNFSYQPCGHGGNFIFTVSYQWLSSFWRTTAILFPSCKFAIVTAQYSTWKE